MLKPLFKGLKLGVFSECVNCHMLSELGNEKCKECGSQLKTDDDAQVHVVAMNMGAQYTPYVECPNCNKLVKVGARRCADCYEEIPEEYALRSAFVVVTNTVACDVANSINGFGSFALLAVIGSVAVYLIDLYVSGRPTLFHLALFWSAFPLISILLWFHRFGKFELGDEDYQNAKRDMRRLLTLWLAIASAQLVALGIWWI